LSIYLFLTSDGDISIVLVKDKPTAYEELVPQATFLNTAAAPYYTNTIARGREWITTSAGT
jgi:hypothetical protein